MKRPLSLAVLLSATVASASADRFYTTSGTNTNLAAYGDFGISFTLNTNISVTDLSFFGESLGGGDTPYVQLWNDDTDTLLGAVSWGAGEATNGWNTKALGTSIILETGTTYQLQSTAYWVPTYDAGDFNFDTVVASTDFYQTGGWAGWGAPASPSAGTPANNPAAMANFTFNTVPEPSAYALICGFAMLTAVNLTRSRRRS